MPEKTVPARTRSASAAQETTRAAERYVAPPVDIYEDDAGLVVLADLPGVEPKALDVKVEHGMLTIQGHAKHLAMGEPIEREHELTAYFRQFQLPEEVDPAGINADLKHGVLTLRLPRAERAKPRRIEVRAS